MSIRYRDRSGVDAWQRAPAQEALQVKILG
jgi:hypothetical protein